MWETKKELRKEAELAEERAVTHFRKVNQIEMILKNADRNHEMYYETLYKIKRVIFPNTTSKR